MFYVKIIKIRWVRYHKILSSVLPDSVGKTEETSEGMSPGAQEATKWKSRL